jgi:YidC/Oxa1 family membrane protein insertase
LYSYSLVLLTKNTSSIPVLGPIWNLIVEFLGWIMNVIYIGLEKMGIGNIGLAIIIFTLVTRIIIFPTTLKQQKSSRMMQLMLPEMKAIQV